MTLTAICTAKRYFSDRGYLFLARPDGGDIFLHIKEITESGFEPPMLGATVEVEFEETLKGLHATRVLRIEGGVDEASTAHLGAPEPGRVKFFDWPKGYGFAHAFGEPDHDLFFATSMLDGFESPPQKGEAIAIYRSPVETGKLAKVIPWGMVEYQEASDVAS